MSLKHNVCKDMFCFVSGMHIIILKQSFQVSPSCGFLCPRLCLFFSCVWLKAAQECHVFVLHLFSQLQCWHARHPVRHSHCFRLQFNQVLDKETAESSRNQYEKRKSYSSLNKHLMIWVYFLSSFWDDEPEEDAASAKMQSTQNGYKTKNVLIHVIAWARKETVANRHCKVITKWSTSPFQVEGVPNPTWLTVSLTMSLRDVPQPFHEFFLLSAGLNRSSAAVWRTISWLSPMGSLEILSCYFKNASHYTLF